MGRKQKYTPRGYERTGTGNLSATIFASMLQHKAFTDLSNNAKVLYIYMKLQQYGQKQIEGMDNDCFYFNKAMYLIDDKYPNNYKLYSNGKQFQRDLKALVDNGFIEVVERGSTSRTKNIYRYSDAWQRY